MQRRNLSEQDQRFVNRWRLIVIGVYSSLALITLLSTTANPVKDGLRVLMTSSGVANAADLRQ